MHSAGRGWREFVLFRWHEWNAHTLCHCGKCEKCIAVDIWYGSIIKPLCKKYIGYYNMKFESNVAMTISNSICAFFRSCESIGKTNGKQRPTKCSSHIRPPHSVCGAHRLSRKMHRTELDVYSRATPANELCSPGKNAGYFF